MVGLVRISAPGGFNGNLTGDVTGNLTGDVTGDLSGTANQANNILSNGSGFGTNSNRPIACFGSSSTPSGGTYSSINYPVNNPPRIKGDGRLTVDTGISNSSN